MKSWRRRDPLRRLSRVVRDGKVMTMPEDLALYSFDATSLRGEPIAVVLAESSEDIQATVRFACEAGIPVIARGAGSGLSGGSVPIGGGIVLSCERMKVIERIDPEMELAVVQPGVVTSVLQEEVERYGLFYPPDPSSYTISTIGGNVAENAGGLRCFKYGVTGHYVLGMEYVNAVGELQQTGIFDKSFRVPDITAMMVGSEGTLGIFTRIALRLLHKPSTPVTISAYFSSSDDAFSAVEGIISNGWVPSVLEYIDRKALLSAAGHIGMDCPTAVEALLLLELDGSEEGIDDLLPKVRKFLSKRTITLEVASRKEDRDRLWALRRGISPSLIRLGTGMIREDIAVPRGYLSELVRSVKEIAVNYGLNIPMYGHAGDGNLHIEVMYDVTDQSSIQTAKDVAHKIYRIAIELGGTITGEHGIGCAKKEFLSWQHSGTVFQLAQRIKHKLDTEERLNPYKVFD
ncbi:MAG: FAD-linked oxidase C-terminal domain-containing protein [Candidatus Electryoneaceae bacterium]|nr:FAD-linked oxidase C-terminal domain-containing protein [Candidatus Electryoneaceae bacterium]